MSADFLPQAAERYRRCCAAGMRWMLKRPLLHGCFINTKFNSLTRTDYTTKDASRGPGFVYGWIQGRGLEAIATHAAFFAADDPQLTAQLDQCGAQLYHRLDGLQQQHGHAYFCYQAAADGTLEPVCIGANGSVAAQRKPDDIYSFADIFTAKGLLAAADRYCPDDKPRQLAYLQRCRVAIEQRRFQNDERVPLDAAAIAAQPGDYAPRMIMLSACELLHRCGLVEHAAFAAGFIAHVLKRHVDVATGLLHNVPGMDKCNFGHAIEFAGFALASPGVRDDRRLVAQLTDILHTSFATGFTGAGVALEVSAATQAVLNPMCPWWPLPETIRAAARSFALTGDTRDLTLWQNADATFFGNYWLDDLGIATQTRNAAGPVDFVPATPDLDPGYHTGLSLLAAAAVAPNAAQPRARLAD